ncbi:MAG: Ig-like domain-containing protein [Bacilli bacterium]|jgi:hypothetical protein
MVEIDVVGVQNTVITYLKYGMDVRIGGTISGTEVTSGLGVPIQVSENPDVSIHVGKTRLICLGEDSPSSSIQDFTWNTSDASVASVSVYGTIIANSASSNKVIITGIYKYNQYFRVYIEIKVI